MVVVHHTIIRQGFEGVGQSSLVWGKKKKENGAWAVQSPPQIGGRAMHAEGRSSRDWWRPERPNLNRRRAGARMCLRRLGPKEPSKTALHSVGCDKGRKICDFNTSVWCSGVPSLHVLRDYSMEHEDDHGGSEQGSSRAPVASATLRPPKRHGEDRVMRKASPKRQRPSPSPDASTNLPTPRSGSEALLCTDSDSVSGYPPSPQDALLQMDWAPTTKTIVVTDNTARDGAEDSDPRICYGTVRSRLFLVEFIKAALR